MNNKYKNLSASALLKTGVGTLSGLVVNSHTSGTIKFWDNTEASGAVITNTFTFPAGSYVLQLPQPIAFTTGLYATIGGTADVTVIYS